MFAVRGNCNHLRTVALEAILLMFQCMSFKDEDAPVCLQHDVVFIANFITSFWPYKIRTNCIFGVMLKTTEKCWSEEISRRRHCHTASSIGQLSIEIDESCKKYFVFFFHFFSILMFLFVSR